MRLDTRRFAFGVAAAWAVWYTICSFLVTIAPAQTQAIFSFAMHYDVSGARNLTWPSFFGGLGLTTAWVGVFAATVGGFFNAWSGSRISDLTVGQKAETSK